MGKAEEKYETMNKRAYYDRADAPYLLKEDQAGDAIEAGEDIFVKLDEKGVVGVEIWRASDLLEPTTALKPTTAKI